MMDPHDDKTRGDPDAEKVIDQWEQTERFDHPFGPDHSVATDTNQSEGVDQDA